MHLDAPLTRLQTALKAPYGDNIDRIVLFGSRARDDARPDSDYDVAIFLKTLPDRRAGMRRASSSTSCPIRRRPMPRARR